MTSVLSQTQFLSGRGVIILENPIPRPKRNANKKAHIYKWHHLGIGWFQSMSMFLHTIKGSIIVKDLWITQPVRESDSILMDDFRNAIKLSEWEWAKVNSVRLWLRSLTVADITNPPGRHIEAWARVGNRRLESNLSWPRQEQPSTSAYCIWRKCLRLAYNPSSPLRLRLKAILPLRRPLRAWIKRSHVQYSTTAIGMNTSSSCANLTTPSTATASSMLSSVISLQKAFPAIYHIVLLPFQ
jgi:hypothetical protein